MVVVKGQAVICSAKCQWCGDRSYFWVRLDRLLENLRSCLIDYFSTHIYSTKLTSCICAFFKGVFRSAPANQSHTECNNDEKGSLLLRYSTLKPPSTSLFLTDGYQQLQANVQSVFFIHQRQR